MRRIERGDDALLIHQEAVTQIVRIKVVPHDGSIRSKAAAKSTLADARARARNIECGDDALLIPQEAVVRIDPVIVESCDLPTWADCEGKRTGADFRTRHIECGKGAISIPDETVTHEGRVSVPSRDRPVRVDDERAERKSAFGKWPRARARRIENGNHALIGANVAVEHIACVTEESRNGPTRVRGIGPRPLEGGCARTGRVEDGETAILRPDETVPHIVRVTGASYDCPGRADVEGKGALAGARARTRRVKGGDGLRRYWARQRQGDQDDCRRRHKRKSQPSRCFHGWERALSVFPFC